MKRILMVVGTPLLNSGVPNVVMQIVRNLREQYIFDVLTYSNGVNGYYDSEFISYGGKIYRAELLEYDKSKLRYPYRYFQISRTLKSIINDNVYDVIHCHNGIESGICMKIAKKKKIKIRISHAHGNYARKGKNFFLLLYNYACKKMIARNSTIRLSCSTESGNTLFQQGFLNVLNPIETHLFSKIEKVGHDSVELLQIGYFCSNKNQLFSIKLLHELIKQNIKANLNLIGFEQECGYLDLLKNYINDNHLNDFVKFLPPNTDKSIIFKKTDCILLPSYNEGLPIVALESQTAGIPCIISDSVSRDANLGLAYFCNLDKLEQWIETVRNVIANKFDISQIEIDAVDVKHYALTIRKFYEGDTYV